MYCTDLASLRQLVAISDSRSCLHCGDSSNNCYFSVRFSKEPKYDREINKVLGILL